MIPKDPDSKMHKFSARSSGWAEVDLKMSDNLEHYNQINYKIVEYDLPDETISSRIDSRELSSRANGTFRAGTPKKSRANASHGEHNFCF